METTVVNEVEHVRTYLIGLLQKGVRLFWLSELRKKIPCERPDLAIAELRKMGWRLRQYESNQQVYEIEDDGGRHHRNGSEVLQTPTDRPTPKGRGRSKKGAVDRDVPTAPPTRLEPARDREAVRPAPHVSPVRDSESRKASPGRTLDFFRPVDDHAGHKRKGTSKKRRPVWRWEVNIDGSWFTSTPTSFRIARQEAKSQAALGRHVRVQTLVKEKWKVSDKWKGADSSGGNGPLFDG